MKKEMKKEMKKAFTLIELLVVIAIIALLLSIVAPGLRAAKEVAKRTICANNLKSLGRGVMVYANINKDMLPEGLYQTAMTTDYRYSPAAAYMMLSLKPSLSDAALRAVSPKERIDAAYGFGYLFMNDIISEGEVFYCPGTPSDVATDFGYDAYSIDGTNFPYRNYSSNKPDYIRSSYMYVPQAGRTKVQVTGAGGTGYFLGTAQKASQLSANAVMACDVLFQLDRLPHRKGSKARGSGVNVLYSDGSVGFSNNADAFSTTLWGDSLDDQRSIVLDEYLFRTVVSLLK